MKLYVDAQFTSPYAMSAYVALHEAGMPFDLKPLDLAAREHLGAEYAAQSLTLRVPLLDTGDFRLAESSAIAEYVHERCGGDLYPAELHRRALARQVQAWLRSDFLALRGERPTETIFLGRPGRPLSAKAAAEAAKLITATEELLAQGPFVCGTWCIADVDLALMLNRLIRGGSEVPEPLRMYARRAWDRSSVQSWCKLERTAAPAA